MFALLKEPFVGVQSHVDEWIVDVQDADAPFLQFYTKESILIPITSAVFVEEDAEKRGTSHHEIESGELAVRLQTPFCRTAMTVRLLLILETQGTVWVVVLLLVQQSAHHHICLPDMLIIGRKKILLFHLRIAVDEDDPAVCRLPCQQVTDIGRSHILLVDDMSAMAQFRDFMVGDEAHLRTAPILRHQYLIGNAQALCLLVQVSHQLITGVVTCGNKDGQHTVRIWMQR